MRKNRFTGWRDVFSFTFRQTGKSKSFLSATIGLMFLFAAIMIFINIAAANSDKNKKVENSTTTQEGNWNQGVSNNEVSQIETIYYGYDLGFDIPMGELSENANLEEIQIGSDLSNFNFATFTHIDSLTDILSDYYQNATFVLVENSSKVMIEQLKETTEAAVYLNISYNVEGLNLHLYLPQNNLVSWDDGNRLLSEIHYFINESRINLLGLNEEQKEFSKVNVISQVMSSNVEHDSVSFYLKEYIPMIFCFLLYLMVILYGQLVGTSIATEKSSKVMELLLTSVQPFAIILGKVLAVFSLAMLQICLFIGSILVGNIVGEQIAMGINPNYTNAILDVLTKNNIFAGFNIGNIIMSILFFMVGFLLFSILAGLVGATVSRGEDLGSALSTYQGVVAVGFLLAYMPQSMLTENALVRISRYVPISSPYIMPADILMGKVPLGNMLVSFAILCITTVILIYIVAQVYEMIILHNGNKIGPKEILGMVRIR